MIASALLNYGSPVPSPQAGRRARRRRRRLLLGIMLGALLALLVLPAIGHAALKLRQADLEGYPIIRASVVTDEPTAIEPSLTENGNAILGLEAENLGRVKSIALAIDRSRSMRGRPIVDAGEAARVFVSAKPRDDRLAVLAFGSSALQLTGFTSATIDADTALRTLAIDGTEGTALYDAIVLGSNALAGETLPGKVLIVLTDGRDVSSSATIDDAIAAARKAHVAVYPIGIEGKQFSPAPLQRIADATGGSYYGASSTVALVQIYMAVAEELKRTWRLEYVTAARPGEHLDLVASIAGDGSAEVDVTIPTAFGPPAPVAEKSSRLLPDTLYDTGWGRWIIPLAVGLLVLFAAGVAFYRPRSDWLRDRLAPHVGRDDPTARRAREEGRVGVLTALFRLTERLFGSFRAWTSVQRLLVRANLPLRAVELFYLAGSLAVVVALLVAVTGASLLVVLVAFFVSGFAPLAFVSLRARKRVRAFEDQLPDLLVTFAAALKAGHSFRQGLQTLVDEGAEPAASEFKRVLTETQLGRPVDQALADMAERVGSKNFEFVVTSVAIQREVGGSLAGLFDTVADTVRLRQQFIRKVRGLTAMGRASAYVLILLPFFVGAALTVLNRDYMDPFFSSSTGQKLIVAGLVMMVVGSVLLRRIVSFRG